MESVTPIPQDGDMEIFMNLTAGVAGAVFTLVGLYAIASIWSDDLP